MSNLNRLSNNFNVSSEGCAEPNITFKHHLYAVTYTIVFIPGLLANSAALWVLCRFISKKNKAVIFMINLAVADLAHVLSLPLRIYYYINNVWPFGHGLCLLCFYLKYLNMYASICFLTCISIQRYFFLYNPFKAKDWKRRYDAVISVAIWMFVGAACSPFPIMRYQGIANNASACFADLAVKKIKSMVVPVVMTIVAELLGFVGPLIVIVYCTWKTKESLQTYQMPLQNSEKRKALRMISTCAIVFFICFTPYHINFFFYMMVKEDIITDCSIRQSTLYTQPFCLSLASLDCCLDPILYFFTTSEFQDQISRHSSIVIRSRLMSKESGSSVKE
uniref:Putative P2Y purinoceptor 10 n=1 Tax=Crocodylus porosus TaxID=8502 RepID=A0A7M4EQT3_CROPO